ncbi:GTPase [Streptomyces sp. NPDC057555]|uniref:GTPase n=1 Tax=Streptomyces sp. NPDC057555 TaxID=3346166 RepID=UPI00367C8420
MNEDRKGPAWGGAAGDDGTWEGRAWGDRAWDDGVIARRVRGGELRNGAEGAASATGPDVPLVSGAEGAPAEAKGAYGRGTTSAARGARGEGDVQEKSVGGVAGEGRGNRGSTGETGDCGARYAWGPTGVRRAVGEGLRPRLDALRELIALSRSRLDRTALDEAGRVLEAADERHRLSRAHTVVALAGATGSGKSSLFNALAGAHRSETGARRPTTGEPVACVWSGGRPGAEGLLRRLGVPVHRRHTPVQGSPELAGLVLLDLPDHDSSAAGHREQVDRLLELVDAVVWVVDPEKYADAVLHERYLRPLAGYAEVTFVVLNQVDRLPGDAADQVVDDLRRLLDEDGLALGEHGEPGAAVLALSAATGEGVAELREALAQFVAERGAAERRLTADVDTAAERLRPAYVAESRVGLTERAREEFDARLAEAVGAMATGRAAERDWLRHAERACGSPWSRPRARRKRRGAPRLGAAAAGGGGIGARTGPGTGASSFRIAGQRAGAGRADGTPAGPAPTEAAGAAGAARSVGAVGVERAGDGRAAARPVVEQAVRAVAVEAARGLPAPWAQAVREAAVRGAEGLPDALDTVAAEAEEALRRGPNGKPRWWTVAAALQGLLFVLQVVGVLWVLGAATGVVAASEWVTGLLPAVVGLVGGPALTWLCGVAARGPARRYGQETERRLRAAAAGCGRARVLEPVAAELLRYREVRERYAVASGV